MNKIKMIAYPLSSLWIATGGLVLLSQVGSLAIIRRYGQWVYTTTEDRLAFHAFMAAAAVVIGFTSGLLFWTWTRLVDVATRIVRRRWLGLAAVLTTGAWIAAVLTSAPVTVFTSPIWVLVIASSFSLTVACARGARPWLLVDVAFLLCVATGLLLLLGWLNLAYLQHAFSTRSSVLNILVLAGAQVLIAVGLPLLATTSAQSIAPLTKRPHWMLSRASIALCGLVLVSGTALLPLYRLTAAANTPARPASSAPFLVDGNGALSSLGVDSTSLQADNMILISLDTLRADHLGIYGYGRPTTPNVDEFFSGGALFAQATSQAPWTLPSHVSMLTGQYPSTHGVRVYPTVTRGYIDPIPPEATTLAEIASAGRLQTAGFTGGAFLSREYGFDQGFAEFSAARSGRMHEVLDMALPWLRSVGRQRFFLFLHSYDCHRYNPPRSFQGINDDGYRGPLRAIRDGRPEDMENLAVGDGFYSLDKNDIRFLEFLYDSEIRNADEELGRLFRELARLEFLENTVVILTSDHGESFYEHRATGHGFDLYDPALHVPLLVRPAGGIQQTVISQRVQTVDIAPTILELLGLTAPDGATLQGRSLVPAILGSALPDRPVVCEADTLDTQASLVMGRYKYINYGILSHNLLDPRFVVLSLKGLLSPYAKREELFDLESDPLEQANLAREHPRQAMEFRDNLMNALKALRAEDGGESTRELRNEMSPEVEDQLRSLGYLD